MLSTIITFVAVWMVTSIVVAAYVAGAISIAKARQGKTYGMD